MKHVVLLGDSVFDNAAYVGRNDPDVRQQLEHLLPQDWQGTCIARDGAMIADVLSQLRQVPRDASHLVISAGGNDALQESGVLNEPASSVAEAMEKLALVGARFRRNHAALLQAALRHALPTAICTIYEPRFPDPVVRRISAVALTALNDTITREAFACGTTVIDLRTICNSDEDFANPIEPSVRGGEKIARAVSAFVNNGPPSATVIAT